MTPSVPANRMASIGIAIATVIVLFPVLSVTVPPILDYPNHYARLWLLSGGANDPSLSSIYRIDWSLTWVNSFMDVVATLLGPLVGVHIVSAIVLSLGLLVPQFGVALLNRSLFGTFSSWNVLCFMLCWNRCFLAGWINMAVGFGLALVAAALEPEILLRLRSMAFAARFVFALAIILVHPFGGMFYFALLIALAVGSRFESFLSRMTLPHAVARAANRGWPVVLALAVIVIFGPKLPGSNEEGVIWQWSLSDLAPVFVAYFRSYSIIYDALVTVLFVSIVTAAALRGRLRYHAGLLAVSLMLGLVTPFVPKAAMGTDPLNARLPMMMVLAMAAGLRPELEVSVAASRFAVGAALALVLLRTAYITTVWRGAERDLAAVRSAVASVEPGSAVLPVQYEISSADRQLIPTGRLLGGTPNYWHYPSLVVVDRKAFMPWLFSAPGKQPLRVLPPWSEISIDAGEPPPVSALTTITAGSYAFVNDWRSRFDYVLLLNADWKSNGPTIEQVPGLRLVTDQGFARLYRVTNRLARDPG